MTQDKDIIRWEDIFQAINHPSIILDPEHKILAANKASIRLTGRSPHELIGKLCYEIFHGDENTGPPEGCPMEKLLQSEQIETVEMEMEAIGGHFLISCTPIFDKNGKLQQIIHIATDIKDRKKVEEDLKKAEQQLQTVIETAPV